MYSLNFASIVFHKLVFLNSNNKLLDTYRTSHWSCSVKKVHLKILQISQENTCAEVSFQ